jgi:hypothetical protein
LIELGNDLILAFELLVDLFTLMFKPGGNLMNFLNMLILFFDKPVLMLPIKHVFLNVSD